MMVVFFLRSSSTQSWRHLSQFQTRYVNLSSFCPLLGTYAVIKQNFQNSIVKTLPQCECSGWGRSYFTEIGRYFEKIATPEYPSEALQKFQYPWYPSIFMAPFFHPYCPILVQLTQIMSGFDFSRQLSRSFLLSTDLIPLTFHEEIKSLSGVFPVPYYQSDSLDFPCRTSGPSLNCFDLDLTIGLSCAIYFEKSLVCFSFFSY